jgi:hypothetical protein
MIDKIIEFFFQAPLILMPFIVTIPSVHFIKRIINDDNKERKAIKVIGISYAVSFIYTLLPTFAYNPISIDMIIYQIALSTACMVLSSGVVVVFDILVANGMLTAVINFLKSFIKPKE